MNCDDEPVYEKCPECKGLGSVEPDSFVNAPGSGHERDCWECGGSGKREIERDGDE